MDEKALTVPVVQFDALGATENLAAGADIVVTGSVKRRFYRAGGQTQSRTEVVADKILPATATKRVEKAIATATERCAIVT